MRDVGVIRPLKHPLIYMIANVSDITRDF
jgi:hypothetical protein